MDLENIKAGYQEYGNQIRHFSATRSALTVFLCTVSATLFVGTIVGNDPRPAYVGFCVLPVAVIVCLVFSYRTEEHVILYVRFWGFLKGNKTDVGTFDKKPHGWEVLKRMLRDPINW